MNAKEIQEQLICKVQKQLEFEIIDSKLHDLDKIQKLATIMLTLSEPCSALRDIYYE